MDCAHPPTSLTTRSRKLINLRLLRNVKKSTCTTLQTKIHNNITNLSQPCPLYHTCSTLSTLPQNPNLCFRIPHPPPRVPQPLLILSPIHSSICLSRHNYLNPRHATHLVFRQLHIGYDGMEDADSGNWSIWLGRIF